jgi:hypothetical protein
MSPSNTFTVVVNPQDTINIIKQQIQKKTDIVISNQCLKYQDKQLEDNSYCSIIPEFSTLWLSTTTTTYQYNQPMYHNHTTGETITHLDYFNKQTQSASQEIVDAVIASIRR